MQTNTSRYASLRKNPLVVLLGISAIFFVLFLVVTGLNFYFMSSKGSGSRFSFGKSFSSKEKVAVIEVNGVIADSKKILEYIDDINEDKTIKGVLVRLNSPGGSVGPSQEIYSAFKKLAEKIPVYSSMASVAASGAYYIACGTEKIFSNPGTITGSIGVIMPFANLSGLYEWVKVRPYNIKTGKFKDIGSPNREMTEDEKTLLHAMLDNVLEQFRKAVQDGRKLTRQEVVSVSDGRIFSGEQAKTVKLVDELGGFNEAVSALAEKAGIKGKPKIVYMNKKRRWIEELLMGDDDDEASLVSQFLTKVISKSVLKTVGVDGHQRAEQQGLQFLWSN